MGYGSLCEEEQAMIALVCGDRNWTDVGMVTRRLKVLQLHHPDSIILEGGCRGADLIAREVAQQLGLDVIEIPANWVRHGKAAGPIRNRIMLDFQPGLVIVFHPGLARSKGTADCVKEARRRGFEVEVIDGAATHG